MTMIQSNSDALLVAIPMIGILLGGYFRLDEMLIRPKQQVEQRRQFSALNEHGQPVCIDPDGRIYEGKRRNY
ncbi:hypothetical protein [Acidicapsa ligni]|uniref:hypothetical protein n=1 Tax=Acidicapsa ligni TaxID=542300 RepID=UPI0021E010D1|nr:hypothetical protein [Acidicapsa ligni]